MARSCQALNEHTSPWFKELVEDSGGVINKEMSQASPLERALWSWDTDGLRPDGLLAQAWGYVLLLDRS